MFGVYLFRDKFLIYHDFPLYLVESFFVTIIFPFAVWRVSQHCAKESFFDARQFLRSFISVRDGVLSYPFISININLPPAHLALQQYYDDLVQ